MILYRNQTQVPLTFIILGHLALQGKTFPHSLTIDIKNWLEISDYSASYSSFFIVVVGFMEFVSTSLMA